MKSTRLLLLFPLAFVMVMLSGTGFVACKKTVVRDSVRVADSVYDLTGGLVAYYNFKGANLKDSSGYNNNITFNNAIPAADRNGQSNNAYLFNGVSSYMSVPNSASLSPTNVTLYAIIKINGFYSGAYHDNMIFVKGHHDADGEYFLNFVDWPDTAAQPDTANEYFDGAYGDNAPPNAGIGIGPQTVNNHLSAGVWYKLAFTYDGVTARLYINGVLKNTKAGSVPLTPNAMDLIIGKNADPSGLYPFWFNGIIDEIRIYNRALPDAAITQLSKLAD